MNKPTQAITTDQQSKVIFVDPEPNALPWDRLDNEPEKAYAAFVLYRDGGIDRSIDKAFQLYTQQKSNKRATGRFTKWSADYQWYARARAYDIHLERLARAERETKHLAEIEEYRNTMAQVARATLSNATQMLTKVNQTLKAELEEANKKKTLGRNDIPQWSRAANDAIEKAATAWAQSLGLEALIELLEVDNGRD